MITIRVTGTPAPQGSKRARPIYRGSKKNGTREFTGKVNLTEMSPNVEAWREAVQRDAQAAVENYNRIMRMATYPDLFQALTVPVQIEIIFLIARPKSAKRPFPSVAPDLDKLVRSTLDGLTSAGVLSDDKIVCGLITEKVYAESGQVPGAVVVVRKYLGTCR